MKITVKFLTSLLIGVLFLFMGTSCEETPPPTDDNSNRKIIEIKDDIKSPTTWTGEYIYLISKHDFYVESLLTIKEGTIIKFNSNALNISVAGNGKIIANGSRQNPIIFTSYRDDSHGGKINGTPSSTPPEAGDWNTIELKEVNGSEFNYCEFLYGGKNNLGKAAPTLSLTSGTTATISNCTFANNGGVVDQYSYIGTLHAAGAGSNTIIRNNSFYDNVLPLTISCNMSLDNSNSFSKSGATNTMNGIFVAGTSINNNVKWEETEVAFVMTSTSSQINSDKVLTLGNNVVLKFVNKGNLSLGSGVSSLVNYNGSGVWFTSIKDDELKGDTNGDGSFSSPNIADWGGIFLNEGEGGYANWNNIKYSDPNIIVK
jgi:hypothetical protein